MRSRCSAVSPGFGVLTGENAVDADAKAGAGATGGGTPTPAGGGGGKGCDRAFIAS